jgi:hypothetical protein
MLIDFGLVNVYETNSVAINTSIGKLEFGLSWLERIDTCNEAIPSSINNLIHQANYSAIF